MDWHASYINLDSRPDRREHMEKELARVGIQAERTRGIPWEELNHNDPKMQLMKARTPGAIGCHYSQVSVMEKALTLGKHALVMEDDLVWCKDFDQRLPIIEAFCNTHPWDVFWLGGCYHLNPQWHRAGHSVDEIRGKCDCTLDRDWEDTDSPYVRRTYGSWSTHCYIVNKDSLAKVLEMLESNVHRSIGIDALFIILSPKLYTYAFVPGCVKQYDNQSNIGNGVTEYSRFKFLGPHWYQDYMHQYPYPQ